MLFRSVCRSILHRRWRAMLGVCVADLLAACWRRPARSAGARHGAHGPRDGGGHVGQAADGDRQPARDPDGAHRIGNVLAPGCRADARHPRARRRLDVHDARRRVRDVRQAEWPARRRSPVEPELGDAHGDAPDADEQAPAPRDGQCRAVDARERGLSAAPADRGDVQGPAALRSTASARPVHGARRRRRAHGQRPGRRLPVRGARSESRRSDRSRFRIGRRR